MVIPKGKLLIIGGAEDKGDGTDRPDIIGKNKNFQHFEILGELVPHDAHDHHTIEVITTASEIPVEVGERYVQSFANSGFNNVRVMRIESKRQAKNPLLLERIAKADAVLFSGGNQMRLAHILGQSSFLEIVKRRYFEEEKFIVAGTSAGAMAMAGIMIFKGDTNEAILKGDVKLTKGFSLLPECIVDSHFVKRGRFGRLAEAVALHPGKLGIGLGEDTALIIEDGNIAECRGSGMVVVIDGREIISTNIKDVEVGQPVCIENMKVHILAKGSKFLLKERHFVHITNK